MQNQHQNAAAASGTLSRRRAEVYLKPQTLSPVLWAYGPARTHEMDLKYDTAFTSLKYAFSEFCLADQGTRAERVLDLVRGLGWDVERVERNRPACIDDGVCKGTGQPMLRVHSNSALAYLTDASYEFERFGMRQCQAACDDIRRDMTASA